MRFSYLPQSFDTYVENVMPGFFQFRPILQQLLSIGRIQVKLDLQYQKVSGFLVDTQHNQKLVKSILVFEGILTVDHLPTSASPLNRICWSAQPTNNFMRAKVPFSSFEVRPGGSVGCWPSSAPVCRPNFWSIKSYNEDPVCSLVGSSRIWVLPYRPYTVRIFFYPTFIQYVWIQSVRLIWSFSSIDFFIDRSTTKGRHSREEQRSAGLPPLREPSIVYLLPVICN